MKTCTTSLRLMSVLLLMLSVGIFATSCEDDDYDHSTQPGQGALIIDNDNGREDVNFYLDGEFVAQIGDGHDSAYDLAPGVYRVVIVEEDSGLSFRDDIDIIEGRLTIIDVTGVSFDSGLGAVVSVQ